VLIGTRRARRRQQQMSDHWRKIMAIGGVEGAEPEDVAKRLADALERLEREHDVCDAKLHKLERGNKGVDVCAVEVKRLKVLKLQIKDDALRLRNAAEATAQARLLGRGGGHLHTPRPRHRHSYRTRVRPLPSIPSPHDVRGPTHAASRCACVCYVTSTSRDETRTVRALWKCPCRRAKGRSGECFWDVTPTRAQMSLSRYAVGRASCPGHAAQRTDPI
jgi:uncharacterized protein YdcH (DUF465 family)